MICYIPLGTFFNLFEAASDTELPAWLGSLFIITWIGWAIIFGAAIMVTVMKGNARTDGRP